MTTFWHVSIHAPARGATVGGEQVWGKQTFQSTRPQGARHDGEDIIEIDKLFQSTRPQGARRAFGPTKYTQRCFNPRARKGRDFHGFIDIVDFAVSIHAPARGATAVGSPCCAARLFQSTRPQGARPHFLRVRCCLERFNPRARKGRDNASYTSRFNICCFNPRARKGRDLAPMRFMVVGMFQSTRPQGARPLDALLGLQAAVSIHAPARGATTSSSRSSQTWSFNPRARKGRDRRRIPDQCMVSVSIHAPARGATPLSTICCGFSLGFNPRARKGRDWQDLGLRPGYRVSIHAPARGATASPWMRCLSGSFQSTRPQGARLQ